MYEAQTLPQTLMPVRSQFQQKLAAIQTDPGLEDVLGCNMPGLAPRRAARLPPYARVPEGQLVVDAGAHHHQRAEGGQGGRPSYVRGGPEISTLD